MNQLGFPLLSIVIFLPLVGALVTLALGKKRAAIKTWALIVTLSDLALACVLWGYYSYEQAGMQFVDQLAWIEAWGVSYLVGVDGINFWLLLLTAFLSPVAILASWQFLDARPGMDARLFTALLLVLQTGAMGVFAAVDLILFYVFWEAMLIPAYFLIGRWGGEKRIYASLKFFLYTMAGSAFMLVAIIALAFLYQQQTGNWTFNLINLYDLPLAWPAEVLLFAAFVLAFAVKAPIWPLHTWLPDAYIESPTPVTILLAGVLSKMGIYGLIRFCLPLFPRVVEAARPWLWLAAIVGILYGSLVALVQKDMKRLIAYSSLAHMGMIVAGVLAANAQGVQGALVQSVSHGLTVTALFVAVSLLEARRGTRLLNEYGGLWQATPILGTLFLTVILASIGLPGLSGFPGEFTMLVGIFREEPTAAVFATLGVVLGAWYMLRLFRQTFAGPVSRAENRALSDLSSREATMLVPIVILIFVIGLVPNLILQPTERSVDSVLSQAAQRRTTLVEGIDTLSSPAGPEEVVPIGRVAVTRFEHREQ
jgi:NADH-quinone oxidoreductase subunit M